jgi:hypothetical protein
VREGEGERMIEVGNGAALVNVCSQHASQYRGAVSTVGKQRGSSH